jgi:hypothetical protein
VIALKEYLSGFVDAPSTTVFLFFILIIELEAKVVKI